MVLVLLESIKVVIAGLPILSQARLRRQGRLRLQSRQFPPLHVRLYLSYVQGASRRYLVVTQALVRLVAGNHLLLQPKLVRNCHGVAFTLVLVSISTREGSLVEVFVLLKFANQLISE